MDDIPGYQLLRRRGGHGGPHKAVCWYATREGAPPAFVVVYNRIATVTDKFNRAFGRAPEPLAVARMRLPRSITHINGRTVVELDASRAELGQRDMLQFADRLGLSLQRTPQEAARLTLALIRAMAPLMDPIVRSHCDANRVLLSADGRLRFDTVLSPLFSYLRHLRDYSPPEGFYNRPCNVRAFVYFVGLALLYHFGAGCPPPPARLRTIGPNGFNPDTKHLQATAPGLAEVAARATAFDCDVRYPDLETLAREVQTQATQHEDTFPHPDAPAPKTPERLLEALRESLNAGHLSAALAHLDLVPNALYNHPAVRDYVQHHVERQHLDGIVDDVYRARHTDDRPLDWAALHLAAQHPDVRARFFDDSLGRHAPTAPASEHARGYVSLWASGRPPVIPTAQYDPPSIMLASTVPIAGPVRFNVLMDMLAHMAPPSAPPDPDPERDVPATLTTPEPVKPSLMQRLRSWWNNDGGG